MSDIFQSLSKPNEKLFFRRNDRYDVRLGEIVPNTRYEAARIVIVGCPQDEGIKRRGWREGTALAPDAIRAEFYRLTSFGFSVPVCDLGNLELRGSLEETHDTLTAVVKQILADGKKAIVLGGGNDISYANGKALAETVGAGNWLAVNVDARFDVNADGDRNSGTAYRQLLEEKLIRPDYFYEIAYQPHFASPVYFRYLQNLGVNLVSLDQIRSRETSDLELRELMRDKFIHHSESLNSFFGFDLSVVRSSDAPGTNAPSPIGLRSGEFLKLVEFAARLTNTRIVEFTEVNPNFDVDNRTSQLVAIALHRFCALQK